jgi:hypothetical protein
MLLLAVLNTNSDEQIYFCFPNSINRLWLRYEE